MSKVTLEQWRVFHAVVESGGFTQAAELLHKSQSSISYSVNKLQQQLGFSILVMEGRKMALTERGQLLFGRSKALLQQADDLEQVSQNMGKFWGEGFNIKVDKNIPTLPFYQAILSFQEAYPGVHIFLNGHVISLISNNLNSPTIKQIEAKKSSLSSLRFSSSPFTSKDEVLCQCEWVAVKSSCNKLPFTSMLQAEKWDQDTPMDALSENSNWSVNDLLSMVKSGIASAYLPVCEIQSLINQGELVLLDDDPYIQNIFVNVSQGEASVEVIKLFKDLLRNKTI